MKFKLDPKQLLGLIKKSRTFLLTMALLAVCGYTAYLISVVVAIAPNDASVRAARANAADMTVHFDTKTINAITHQNSVSVSPNLGGIGSSNPFFPQ